MPAESAATPHLPVPEAGTCRAVIDVGTNSVKLLVARVHGSVVHPLLERGIQTRLGEGFFDSNRLLPEAIERTARVVAALHQEALSHRPVRLRIVATAAAREALNRDDLVKALCRCTQSPVEVISGEREAALAFEGVCSHPALAAGPLLVTDVGGGSTEFIVGRAGHRRFAHSYPIGAVRLFERLRPPAAPTRSDLLHCRSFVDDLLRAEVSPGLAAFLTDEPVPDEDPSQQPLVSGPLAARHAPLATVGEAPDAPLRYVGVGGTTVILARIACDMTGYDRDRIEATHVSAAALVEMTERLWGVSLTERRKIPGLPPERADIILTGVAIYEGIVRVFDLAGMQPSTRGLRYAALLAS